MSNEVINPYQTFRDDNGNVLANGTVGFYINTTATLDTIFSDEALTVSQTNPYPLDAYGRIAGDVKYSGKKTLTIRTESGGFVRTIDNVSTMLSSVRTVIPHDTLAAAVADAQLVDGDALNIAERTTGNGGGAMWDVVLSSDVTDNTFNVVQCVGVGTLSLVLREWESVSAATFGAVEDGSADDTASTDAAISEKKETIFDKTGTQKITTISINDSIHLKDANIVFNGLNAGFDIDTATDGLTIVSSTLAGDGVLSNDQKGITSDAAITRGYFTNVHLKDLVQGFDLNSAINTVLMGNVVECSVGEAAGEGYGVIAGSSQRGVFNSNIFEDCQRHGLYLNNTLYSTANSNVFYKHRDGLATGGGLGALQIAGQAKGIPAVGNSFSTCTGPELVISPQPANTSPEECVLATGNTHYGGNSANIRIGGATPSANENVKGNGVTSNIFQPAQDHSGGVVQVYSGFGINVSYNTWYLKDGTGTSPAAIRLGLTTPDDAYFDNISICGNNGIFTKNGGGAIFIDIDSVLCVGTTRIDIFDNHVETDTLIDYATTPTNPNIRTDSTQKKSITLASGAQDLNVAGYNEFILTGDAAGSSIDDITNGYEGKEITLRINDVNVVTLTSTGNKSVAGTFASTNKDIIVLRYDGSLWREITRSLNT